MAQKVPNCMFRYYVLHGSRMSRTFSPNLSTYVEAHVFFYSSVLTQVADSFQVREDEVDLPSGIFNWFKRIWITLMCLMVF